VVFEVVEAVGSTEKKRRVVYETVAADQKLVTSKPLDIRDSTPLENQVWGTRRTGRIRW